MEQTATICGGQVWKAFFKGAPSSLDKKVKRMGGRGRRKIQICEFARRVTAPSAPRPLAPMLVVMSRENITTATAAAHKFVTAVLQMASSIFPARPFLLPPFLGRSARILYRGAGWIRGPPMSIRGRRAEISATGDVIICDCLDFVAVCTNSRSF